MPLNQAAEAGVLLLKTLQLFNKLLLGQVLDKYLLDEIDKLLNKKTSGLEIDIEPKSLIIIEFFKEKIEHYEQYLRTVKKGQTLDCSHLDALFMDTLKEVWGRVF